jgi:hypothetical protein
MFKVRILNKELDRSSKEFVSLIEAMYEEELGIKKV